MEWTADLQTGIEEIDSDHKEICARVEALLAAMRAGKGRDKIPAMIEFVTDYVSRHFALEERHMRETGYSYLTQHVAEHRAFLQSLQELREEAARRGSTTAMLITLCDRLFSYLRQHIQRTDRQMASYLQSARLRRVDGL